jgi:hypothetical protein
MRLPTSWARMLPPGMRVRGLPGRPAATVDDYFKRRGGRETRTQRRI